MQTCTNVHEHTSKHRRTDLPSTHRHPSLHACMHTHLRTILSPLSSGVLLNLGSENPDSMSVFLIGQGLRIAY